MKLLVKRILSYFPTKLPVGMTEFKAWSADIIELVGPIADERSLRWAVSNMIMHLPSTNDRAPKNYFVKCLRKTAANQVAGQVFLDIKAEQEEAAKKAAEAQAAKDVTPTTAEVTAPAEASNVQEEKTT